MTTMEYYSPMKKIRAWLPASSWMDFEDIMPNEKNHTKGHIL